MSDEGEAFILQTPSQLATYHMLSQYHACKLHAIGLKHSSGRSIIKHVKQQYGLKGNNAAVIEQLRLMLCDRGINL